MSDISKPREAKIGRKKQGSLVFEVNLFVNKNIFNKFKPFKNVAIATMKRISYLIETLDSDNEIFHKRVKENISQANNSKMHRSTIWYRSLLAAEKTCLKDDKIKKVWDI